MAASNSRVGARLGAHLAARKYVFLRISRSCNTKNKKKIRLTSIWFVAQKLCIGRLIVTWKTCLSSISYGQTIFCFKLKFCRKADSKFEEEQREAITGEEHNLRNYNEYSANDSHRKHSTVDVS